jgi:hypothetical protein
MPTKPLDRLMFAQGGFCFFCRKALPMADASVEHLFASANGGGNNLENCVVCCKALNALLGSMSLKEKFQIVLNQQGQFKCPNDGGKFAKASPAPHTSKSPTDRLSITINNLQKLGSSRPRALKSLTSTIGAFFQKKLSEHEISVLIDRLQAQGKVVVNGTKVSYELPEKNG